MNGSASGRRQGPSTTGSLRLLRYAAGMTLAGGMPLVGTLQALSTPDPPLRLAVLAAWITHTTALATVVRPLRTILVFAFAVLAAIVLVRLCPFARRAARTAATGAAGIAAAPGPVIVVGAITGNVGRAWLDGRVWTVRCGAGPLRRGELYVVTRRGDDLLEVMPAA